MAKEPHCCEGAEFPPADAAIAWGRSSSDSSSENALKLKADVIGGEGAGAGVDVGSEEIAPGVNS
jgi:hypothetical protein